MEKYDSNYKSNNRENSNMYINIYNIYIYTLFHVPTKQ